MALAALYLHLLLEGTLASLPIPLMALGGRGFLRRYLVARAAGWARRAVFLNGGRVTVSGREKIPATGPVLYVANHQSALDIPVLLGHLPGTPAFVAKQELLGLPMLGFWMRRIGCVAIDRSHARKGRDAVHEAAQRVRGGQRMVLFPEGTRTRDPGGAMQPFRRGSFKIAMLADATVVPVTIEGSRLLMARARPEGFSGRVQLVVHDPIPLAGMDEEARKRVPEQVERLISDALSRHHMGTIPQAVAVP